MSNFPGRVVLAGVFLLLASTACGSEDARPNESVTATLNAETMQIGFPVDAYGMSAEDRQIVGHAEAILIDRCMSAEGFGNPYLAYYQRDRGSEQFPDWRYGVWNAPYVAKNGIGKRGNEVDETKLPEAQLSALVNCSRANTLRIIDDSEVVQGEPPTVLFTASLRGFEAATSGDEGRKIRAEWVACLESVGFRPMPDERSMLVQVSGPEDSEEFLTAIVADAKCKDQLNTVQRLADIDANQQQAYLEQHEAEAIASKDEAKAVVERAQALIRGES
ncbi:hypothetical protein [Neomicrococcus lactis]|uniref:hypothetical protein n=1 Tax=Neomicrococcus lactis TaxID=732241 RepID=UPI002301FB5D|nr:hypothetical protein [Neomicrococcus lactis]